MALSSNHVILGQLDETALSEIDAAFTTIFGSFHSSPIRIATNTLEYKEALALYRQCCVDAARHVQQPGTLQNLGDALAWPENDDIPYPFPTRSFVAWIFDLFGSIPNAVNEVSFAMLTSLTRCACSDGSTDCLAF